MGSTFSFRRHMWNNLPPEVTCRESMSIDDRLKILKDYADNVLKYVPDVNHNLTSASSPQDSDDDSGIVSAFKSTFGGRPGSSRVNPEMAFASLDQLNDYDINQENDMNMQSTDQNRDSNLAAGKGRGSLKTSSSQKGKDGRNQKSKYGHSKGGSQSKLKSLKYEESDEDEEI